MFHKNDDEELDEDTAQAYEMAARTALECLTALFRDHEEFADEESAAEFLNTATSAEDPTLLSKLVRWKDSLLHRLGVDDDGVTRFEACELLDITEKIQPFTKTVYKTDAAGRQQPSPWPLVKIVRYVLQRH